MKTTYTIFDSYNMTSTKTAWRSVSRVRKLFDINI